MHNTGNPLPSKDILDLYDNSETIDNFVNSQQDEVPDRFGTKRLTLAGLIKRSMALRNEINDFSGALTFKPEWSDVPMNVSEGVGGEGGALNLQAEALGNRSEINKVTSREALRRSYAEAGYTLVDGSFEQGGTLNSAEDVLLYEARGMAYSWGGPFLKVVPAGSTPDTTGGIGEGAWLSHLDPELRNYVLNTTTATFKNEFGYSAVDNMIAGRVDGVGGTVEHHVGNIYSTGGTTWECLVDGASVIGDFRPLADTVVNEFGLVSGGADNTSILDGALLNGKSNIITEGQYHINKAFALLTDNTSVRGIGNVELIKSVVGAGVYISWKGDTVYENITVRSVLPDVPQIRTVVNSGAIIRKCNVFDNTHDSAAPDAWGFYFKNCHNATLYDCGASGNSQSDFTIVDDVKNVRIINGNDGGHGKGCILNIEPNNKTLGGVEGVKILGGSYSLVTVIEPYIVGNAINGLSFDGCHIDTFDYNGGTVTETGCTINSIVGMKASLGGGQTGRAGSLTSDSIQLGSNLINEPSMSDISRDDVNSYWTVFSSIPPTSSYIRLAGVTGKYTRLNPNNLAGYTCIENRTPIPVDVNGKFALILTCRKKQNSPQPGMVKITFLDGAGSIIQANNCWFNKSDVIGTTEITTETMFFDCPTGTTALKLAFGTFNGSTTNGIDLFGVGLFQQYALGYRGGSLNLRKAEVLMANLKSKTQAHYPQGTPGFYYPNSFIGERIINSQPTAGGYEGWVCVADGTPGTWKGFGAIQA